MLYATRQYIQMITAALSQETGVRIQESDKWAADPKNNILYYDLESLKYLPFVVVRGILFHEISHLQNTQNDIVPDKTLVDKYNIESLHNIYNAYEDIRIEDAIVKKYGGFVQQSLKGSLLYVLDQNLNAGIDKMSRMDQFLFLSIFTYHSEHTTHGCNDWSELYDICEAHRSKTGIRGALLPVPIDEEVDQRYHEHEEVVDDIITKIKYAENTQEVVNILDAQLIPLVEDFLEEDSKERQEQQQQEGEGTKQRVNLSDLVNDASESTKRLLASSQSSDEMTYIDKPTEQEAIALLNPYIATLTQRLQSILQEKAHTKWRGAHQSGKLLNKHAYKVTIPDETRMFSKKTTPDNPYYHVWIALDASGSMSDDQKGLYAYLGAILLKKVMLNLKCEVDILQYDDAVSYIENIEEEYTYNSGGTQDGLAFDLILKHIRSEENNIIFLLTDGETIVNEARTQNLDALIHRYHAQIFGVGIGKDISQDVLRRMYPNSLQVTDVQAVPQALIGVMRSVIKR